MGAENGLGRWLQVRDQGVSDEKTQLFLQGVPDPLYSDRRCVRARRQRVLSSDGELRAARQADRAEDHGAEPCRAEQAHAGHGLGRDTRAVYALHRAHRQGGRADRPRHGRERRGADGGASERLHLQRQRLPRAGRGGLRGHAQRQLCRGRFGRRADRGDELHGRQLRARQRRQCRGAHLCILRGPGNGRRSAAFDADARAHPARDARRDAHYLVHSVAAYHAPDQEYRGGGEGICLRQLRCARPRGQSLL